MVRVAGAVVLVARHEPGPVTADSTEMRVAEALAQLVSEAAEHDAAGPGRAVARAATQWLMRDADQLSGGRPINLGILSRADGDGLAIFLHGAVTALLAGDRGIDHLRGVDAAFTVDRVVASPQQAAVLFADDQPGPLPELPPQGIGSLVEGVAAASAAIVWFERERSRARDRARPDAELGSAEHLSPAARPVTGQQPTIGEPTPIGQQSAGQYVPTGQQPLVGQQPMGGQHVSTGQSAGGQPPMGGQYVPTGQSPGDQQSAGGQYVPTGQQPFVGQQPTGGQYVPTGQQPIAGQHVPTGQQPLVGQIPTDQQPLAGQFRTGEQPVEGSFGQAEPVAAADQFGPGGNFGTGPQSPVDRFAAGPPDQLPPTGQLPPVDQLPPTAQLAEADHFPPTDQLPEAAAQAGPAFDPFLDPTELSAPRPVAQRGTNPSPPPDPNLERRIEETAKATKLTAKVLGFTCARAHPTDPRAAFCTVCGMPVDQTQHLIEVLRPPLGVLVLDDGTTFPVAADAVLGRDPENSEPARQGLLPWKIEDASGGMSRAHAEIRLANWDVTVVDRGSTNGTRARLPGYRDWIRLQPNQPLTLVFGAEILLGNRMVRFEPAAPPPFG